MTIAAGLVCTNGIVICADSQHSDEQAKYQRDKIWSLPDLSLTVTGAGSTAYLKMSFDKLCDEFKTSAINATDAREKVESIIKEIHAEHLFKFWKPDSLTRPEIALVIAVKCRDGKLALIKTSLTAADLEETYAVVGTGQPMFEYWAAYLYRSNLDIDAMSYLAGFILREAKKSSEYCGGYSLMRKVPAGEYKGPLIGRLFDENRIMADFPDSVTRILSVVANLDVSDEWVKTKLEEFSNRVMAIRQAERQAKEMRLRIVWEPKPSTSESE
jgi:20S proteasome alpha/beta subunit